MLNLLFFSLVILVPHYILSAIATDQDYFITAVEMNDMFALQSLISRKKDVNSLDSDDGTTALIRATILQREEMVTLLIKAGADASIKGPGLTALDHARLLNQKNFGKKQDFSQEKNDRIIALLEAAPKVKRDNCCCIIS